LRVDDARGDLAHTDVDFSGFVGFSWPAGGAV